MMKLVEDCCSFCHRGKSKVKGKMLIKSNLFKDKAICPECVSKAKSIIEESEE